MKYRLVFFLFLASVNFLHAQQQEVYNIIRVQGNIFNVTQNKTLAKGDKITSKDKLKFENKEAKALAISSKSGKFVISPPQKTSPQEKEIVAFLTNVILPIPKNAALSTRFVAGNSVQELASYFGAGTYGIIGNKLSVKMSKESFPMNDNQFFIYRYEYQEKAVNKRIAFTNDTLTFQKEILYKIGEAQISPEMVKKVDIYYMKDAQNKNAELAVTFMPVFINEDILKEECESLIKLYQGKKQTNLQVYKEVLLYIQDLYGRVDESILKTWLKIKLNFES